jgi:hypothetical protein
MTLLTDTLVALLWVGGAILLVLGVHRAARRYMPPLTQPDEDGHVYSGVVRDMASATGFRIAAFYGVILALVYAHELGEYQTVRDGLAGEATAIADVFHDAGRYGAPLAGPVREAMATYVRFVVDREWDLLGEEKRLSNRAWAARDVAYETVLDVEAVTPRQVALRQHMLKRIHDITTYRHLRQEVAAKDFGLVFWVPAIAGLILVTIPFYIYPPGRVTHVLLSCFGAFSGLILFFIQGFASPFTPPFRTPPGAFERLLETDIGATPVISRTEVERRAAQYRGTRP